MDITVEHDLAVAAAAALRQAGEHDRAAVIERRLNPPMVYTLVFGKNEDGYDLHLAESAVKDSRYVMPHIDDEILAEIADGEYSLQDLFDEDHEQFGFTPVGADTALFTQEQMAAFDSASLPAFMTDVQFVCAPYEAEGHDAYESGATELYLCDGLIACGARADRLRDAG
jgi:hypothetical protein